MGGLLSSHLLEWIDHLRICVSASAPLPFLAGPFANLWPRGITAMADTRCHVSTVDESSLSRLESGILYE